MPTPTLTANSPTSGSIAWTAFNISYAGSTFTFGASNTAQRYVWWIYPLSSVPGTTYAGTLASGAVLPTLTDDDLVLFINRAGTPVNVQSANVVDGSLIVTQSIIGDAIAANTIQGSKIIADTLTSREISAGAITVNELGVSGLADSYVINGEMDDIDTTSLLPAGWAIWSGTGTVTLGKDTTTPMSGTQSLTQALPTGAGTNQALVSAAFPVAVGRRLALGGAFRSTSINSSLTLGIVYGTSQFFSTPLGVTPAIATNLATFDVNGSPVVITTNATVGTGYQYLMTGIQAPAANTIYQIAGQVIVPTGATWARMILIAASVAGAYTATWDAFDVRRVVISTYLGDGVIATRSLTATAIDGMTVTGATVRTASGVGTGVAATPAGVVLDSTGLKGYPAVSTVPNTTIDTATGKLTAKGVTIIDGTLDIGSGATSFHVDAAGNHWSGDPIRPGLSNPGISFTETARTNLVANPAGDAWNGTGTNLNWTAFITSGTGTLTNVALPAANLPVAIDTVGGRGAATATFCVRTAWTSADASYGDGVSYDQIAVTAGLSYRMSGYVRPSKGQAMGITAIWLTSGGAVISTSADVATAAAPANVWTYLAATFVAPATAARVRLRFDNVNATVGGQAGSLWANGNTLDATWLMAEQTTDTDRLYFDNTHSVSGLYYGKTLQYTLELTTAQGVSPTPADVQVKNVESIFTMTWTNPTEQTITALKLSRRSQRTGLFAGTPRYWYANESTTLGLTSLRIVAVPDNNGSYSLAGQAVTFSPTAPATIDTTPANFAVDAAGALSLAGTSTLLGNYRSPGVRKRVQIDSSGVALYTGEPNEFSPARIQPSLLAGASSDLDRTQLRIESPVLRASGTVAVDGVTNPKSRAYIDLVGETRGAVGSYDPATGFLVFGDYSSTAYINMVASDVLVNNRSLPRGMMYWGSNTVNSGATTATAFIIAAPGISLRGQRMYKATFTCFGTTMSAAGIATYRIKYAAAGGLVVGAPDALGACVQLSFSGSGQLHGICIVGTFTTSGTDADSFVDMQFGATMECGSGTILTYASPQDPMVLMLEDMGQIASL